MERRSHALRVAPIHTAVRGRARLRVQGLKGCPELEHWLRRALARKPGLHSLSVNPRTGTLLLTFDAEQSIEHLVGLVERAVQAYVDTSAVVAFGAGDEPEPASGRPAPSPFARSGPVAIAAQLPGRARVRVAGLKGRADLARWLGAKLEGMRGIRWASASPLTGRMLLHFDPDVELRGVLDAVEDALRDYAQMGLPASRASAAARGGRRGAPQELPWHSIDEDDLGAALATSPRDGLTRELALRRLDEHGANALPPPRPRSSLALFAGQLATLPVALLGASAVVSALTGGIGDAVVILGVVAINGCIGYATESSSERTIAGLDDVSRPPTLLVREGELLRVPAESVVPGDLLVLRQGTPIVADARVVKARQLSVCEAPLTGESVPTDKLAGCSVEPETPIAGRLNMVYSGTLVTGGSGLAVVTATGRNTEIGNIQRLLSQAEPPATPVERQLQRLGGQLVAASAAICGGVFLVGWLRGIAALEMLKSTISLAVAAVPEGLPAVATTTLAFGVAGLRRRGVLIRHLAAVEALGATQVLCLDKTGTITLNHMTVAALLAGGRRYDVRHGEVRIDGAPTGQPLPPDLGQLLVATTLCNEADFNGGGGDEAFDGSPTENALLEVAIASGIEVRRLRRRFRRVRLSPRTGGRNYMNSLHETADGQRIVAVKGNPDEVLALCSRHLRGGETRELDADARAAVRAENQALAGDSMRVLGVAMASGRGDRESLEADLAWLGLVGMTDPLRDGIPGLIGRLHRAGIDTVMITGDQRATAASVGRALDLARGETLRILDASELESCSRDELRARVAEADVICRASPAHKLEIVEAIQSEGRIVAMTGDGVNDGPALRAADIGIALGEGGTELARSVADVVLEDDELEGLAPAIRQGRTVRANTRKALHFLLSTNLSEILVMLGALAAGAGSPLNPRQLLWLNLVSDVFPGLALALDPEEPGSMERGPRPPDEPILDGTEFRRIAFEGSILTGASLASYAWAVGRYGTGPRARSVAFLSLASGQLLHALTCRSSSRSLFARDGRPRNPYLGVTVAATLALQAVASLVPGLRSLLGTTAIGVTDALAIGLSSVLPLAIVEGSKPAAKSPAPTPR